MRSRLLLITFGVLFAFIIAELGLRVLGMGSIEEMKVHPYKNTSHPQFGWSHFPNGSFVYKTRWVNFGTRVVINSKGLRDREYPYQKESGVFRVLILGDSFTDSLEVPLEQVWHEIIERRLNGSAAKKKIEVIAAGVQGWGTDQQLLYYRHEGFKYDPDLVLVQFYQNDLEENAAWWDFQTAQRMKPFFALVGDRLELKNFPYEGEGYWLESESGSGFKDRVRRLLRRNLNTYRFARGTIIALRNPHMRRPFCQDPSEDRIPRELLVYAPTSSADYVAAWKITTSLIRQLHAETRNHGHSLAIVNFPDRRQVVPEYWNETLECWPKMKTLAWDLDRPNRVLKSLAEAEGVPYLDLTEPLRTYVAGTRNRPYFLRDFHFNPEGHQYVAQLLEPWLSGILSKKSAGR